MDALPQLVTPEAIKLLDRFKILNEREMHARYEVFLENYNKTINIEGQLMVLMANRYILPAAFEYQKQIGQSVAAVKAGGGKSVQGKKLLGTLHQAGGQAEERRPTPWPSCSSTAAGRPRSTRSTCATRWCRRWPSCARRATAIEVLTPHELVAAADLPGDAVREVGHVGPAPPEAEATGRPVCRPVCVLDTRDVYEMLIGRFRRSKTRVRVPAASKQPV